MIDNNVDQLNLADAERCFSIDYITAKERFVDAAVSCGGTMLSYQVGDDPQHTMDVSILGNQQANRTVVVSSGLHGVEGYFGSAVQLAWLLQAENFSSIRVVLIHAINPVGFSQRRRWNEDNVDLNRNFMLADADYQGSTPRFVSQYATLDPLLNPKSPPTHWEPFAAKAVWQILRHGMPALKQAIAGGQYEYPSGCFFGGREACASTRIVQQHYANWIGESSHVVHLDLHTGLGKYAQCKLLLEETQSSPTYSWYIDTFGQCRVEASTHDADTKAKGTAYAAKGSLGQWLHESNRDRRFRFALAEFGTYGPLRVLAALRAENRAHFYTKPDSNISHQSKNALVECFCPSSARWRKEVTNAGVSIIENAIHADRND